MKVKHLLMGLLKPINIPLTRFVLKRHYRDAKPLSSTKKAKKVLVFAPHMDDETIGPGGVIRKHANEGAEIYCVFITDGSNSVSNLSKEELIHTRMNEMNQVKNILGITEIHYLGLPDGHVKSDKTSQNKVAEMINRIQPDIIYSTLYIDAHPDHTETAKILSDYLKEAAERDFTLRLYEINCPIPPKYINCVVDISDTVEDKKQAIDVFTSQAIAFDGFLELNQLKASLVKEKVNAVEVFIEPNIDSYIRHCDSISEKNYDFASLFKQANRIDTLLWAIYKNYKRKLEMYENSFRKR